MLISDLQQMGCISTYFNNLVMLEWNIFIYIWIVSVWLIWNCKIKKSLYRWENEMGFGNIEGSTPKPPKGGLNSLALLFYCVQNKLLKSVRKSGRPEVNSQIWNIANSLLILY